MNKKYLLLLIVPLFAYAYLANAAITLESTSTSGFVNNTTTLKWTHTIPAGLTNSILISVIDCSDAHGSCGITSSTAGGAPATFAAGILEGGFGNNAAVYYQLNPSAGTDTIAAILSAGNTSSTFVGTSLLFSGVDQTTPIDNAVTSTNLTNNITTAANAWIVDTYALGGNATSTTVTLGAGQVLQWFVNNPTNAFGDANYEVGDTLGPNTGAATATASFGTFVQGSHTTVSLNPAASASTTLPSSDFTVLDAMTVKDGVTIQ